MCCQIESGCACARPRSVTAFCILAAASALQPGPCHLISTAVSAATSALHTVALEHLGFPLWELGWKRVPCGGSGLPRPEGGTGDDPRGPRSVIPRVRHKEGPQGRAFRDWQNAVCSVLGCPPEVLRKVLWFVTLLLTGEAKDLGCRVVREAQRGRSTPPPAHSHVAVHVHRNTFQAVCGKFHTIC